MKTLDQVFMARYSEMLNYAAHFVGEDSAADVVQNLFIRLYVKDYSTNQVEELLMLILKRECFTYLDHVRRKRRKMRSYSNMSELDYRHEAQQPFAYQWATWVLRTLPPKRAKCLRLYYLDGLTSREIGAITGNSPCTIRDHFVKGRAQMKLAYARSI